MDLVDSGADFCIFESGAAELLNIKLPTIRRWEFTGTTGQRQTGYLAAVEITILTPDHSQPAMSYETEVAFCESLDFGGLALLGQNGLFSEMKVTFDRRAWYFDVDPY